MSRLGWLEKPCMYPAVFYYRYDDVRYSKGVDQFDSPIPGYNLKVELKKIRVHHFTPVGVRFEDGTFMMNKSKKRYACATEDEARVSFISRKKRQIEIHQDRINQAQTAINMITFGHKHVPFGTP